VRKVSITDLKAKFSSYIKASKPSPVVITKNGKPVAVLLSIQEEEELGHLLMAYSPKLQRILQVAEKQIREEKGIKHEDFWAEITPDA
jgi:prevent-host-death family protein